MNKITKVVIINAFDTYEHRVELLRRFFANSGCEVKVITSDWMHFHKEKRGEVAGDYRLIATKPYYKNLSVQRLRSHYDFAKRAVQRAKELGPQLLWVLAPPNSLVKFSALYKKSVPDIKLVLDFMDMWPETMPISAFKGLPPFSLWRRLRDRYIAAGDLVVTECALYQNKLRSVAKVPPMHTLYLARNKNVTSCELQPPKDKLALCYLGSINNIIDISCIQEILGKIKSAVTVPVQLHMIGDGEKKDELKQAAEQAGAEVIFHGRVYEEGEKEKLLRSCHFGLNVMKESVFVGVTMKSLDYFAYGLPIINNIKGDTWDFVEKHPIGINYCETTVFTKDLPEESAKWRSYVSEFFEKHFSIETFETTLREIVKEL